MQLFPEKPDGVVGLVEQFSKPQQNQRQEFVARGRCLSWTPVLQYLALVHPVLWDRCGGAATHHPAALLL